MGAEAAEEAAKSPVRQALVGSGAGSVPVKFRFDIVDSICGEKSLIGP